MFYSIKFIDILERMKKKYIGRMSPLRQSVLPNESQAEKEAILDGV